jgi:transposase-like protein
MLKQWMERMNYRVSGSLSLKTQMFTELKNRCVTDIFIACVGGLEGFTEAIESVFHRTAVHCVVYRVVRHNLNYFG